MWVNPPQPKGCHCQHSHARPYAYARVMGPGMRSTLATCQQPFPEACLPEQQCVIPRSRARLQATGPALVPYPSVPTATPPPAATAAASVVGLQGQQGQAGQQAVATQQSSMLDQQLLEELLQVNPSSGSPPHARPCPQHRRPAPTPFPPNGRAHTQRSMHACTAPRLAVHSREARGHAMPWPRAPVPCRAVPCARVACELAAASFRVHGGGGLHGTRLRKPPTWHSWLRADLFLPRCACAACA